MRIKESTGRKVFNLINVFVMCILIVITLYPLLYVIFASLSKSSELMKNSGILLKPAGLSTAAYKAVFKNPNIIRGYRNTLIILVLGTFINIVMTSLAAYFFSRKDVMFQKPLMMYVMFTMFFSGGMIPNYLIVKNLGLLNTIWALVLPTAISTYNMIIMRTGFAAIPESLIESAKIDGASPFQIMTKIVMPLAVPGLIAVAIYGFVWAWNDMLYSLTLVTSSSRRTLAPGLIMTYMGEFTTNWANMMAASVIVSIPVTLMFILLQKYFIQGMTAGAVKE